MLIQANFVIDCCIVISLDAVRHFDYTDETYANISLFVYNFQFFKFKYDNISGQLLQAKHIIQHDETLG